MKKYFVFVMIAALVLCAACSSSGSSGAEKVYTLEGCSFALPSSWSDNSSGESLLFTSDDESAGLNASFDDQEPEYRTPLSDRLQDVEYDLGSVSVDGEDVDLYVYQQDSFWMHDFEVVRDDGAYHFVYMSDEQNPAGFESFVSSLRFTS